jgi:hypothetical protein
VQAFYEAEALLHAGWACALVPSDVSRLSVTVQTFHTCPPAAAAIGPANISRKGLHSEKIEESLEQIELAAHEGGTCFLLGKQLAIPRRIARRNQGRELGRAVSKNPADILYITHIYYIPRYLYCTLDIRHYYAPCNIISNTCYNNAASDNAGTA